MTRSVAFKALAFLSWIPVAYTFQSHIYDITQVKGCSMAPTLNPGPTNDFVLVKKFNLKLEVNDVVMFRSPTNPEQLYVKRIKAIQGDTVVTKHPFPKRLVVVPRGHLWVEGDHQLSVDSNNFGCLSRGLVVGKCEQIVWPLERWGELKTGGREVRESMIRLW